MFLTKQKCLISWFATNLQPLYNYGPPEGALYCRSVNQMDTIYNTNVAMYCMAVWQYGSMSIPASQRGTGRPPYPRKVGEQVGVFYAV